MPLSNPQKMVFLEEVQKNKLILFSAFKSNITKQRKQKIWQAIVQVMKAAGAASNIDVAYLRDTAWPNLKRTAKKKEDDRRKTGSGRVELTQVDEMVLDILGRESPCISALPVEETSMPSGDDSHDEESVVYETGPRETLDNDSEVPDNIPQNQEAASSGTKRVHTEVIDDEFVALKKQKLKLEIENLELKNCKLRYQVRWLERKESDLEADEIDSSATF